MLPPAKRSPKHLIEVFDKIAQLKALGVHCYELPLSLERQRYYATRMRRRFPQRFRALAPARRTLELVCFLRMTLMDATDVALALVEKRVAEIWGQARRAAEQHHARTGPEAWITLRAVHHTLHDPIVLDTELRAALCTLVDPLMRKAPSTRAECTRERLCEERSIRSLLHRLLELDFHAAADDPILVALEQLRSLYAAQAKELPADVPCPFAPRWLRLLGGSDRKCALRAFEAATLYALRRALRNGTVWVDYSLSYRSRESMLIPREQWMRDRRKYYRALGLPPRAKGFLERLAAQLHAGLLALEEAVGAGEVGIEEEAIHLKRIVREERPDMTTRVGDALFDAVGPIQLPDLLLEVDSHTRFSWLLLGGAPRTEQMLLGVYGALLAQGTELDAARVALMIPELPQPRIVESLQLLEEPGALAKANAAVLAFLRRHPIVKHWGSGTFASSDMVSLEVSRHLWSARVDPRRRTHAIGTYVHVLDQWGIFYDQPIVLNERQAGAAIEGAIRPAGIRIEALATDTHGYTDYAMGLAKLLGLDLYPRLRDAKHKKLFVPRGLIAPASLQPVLGPVLSLQPVEQHWDELVRLAASVRYGWCSAVMALRHYGAAARGDPLYQAGVILGKLIRSVYLYVIWNRLEHMTLGYEGRKLAA